ncbi:TMEM175 family protein [Conexibacter stalactiti]|uniref:TMEM175 family protein n=1 Tax=Conexibacter stalactiti TaxID=1940611 RepID=A0ABU4HUB3_9ACTN|nr:TMEM175 family protein [Conexibacter stalactiti]MDW5596912.1 TMEM175 family protein [Conexibacter stalactiti]MEC5037554.1 TMEM175 family protein [Conexibacter stalactiti]
MSAPEHEIEEEGSAGYERVVAFSDGVFAIAITLLVLGLDVPDLPESRAPDELAGALRDLGPQVASYFIGFAVIGAFWLGHHRFFEQLRRFDSTLLLLNLAFLAFISLMPFTTGVFGRYGEVEAAVILYAANVVAASGFDTAMLWIALRRELLPPAALAHPGLMLLSNVLPALVFLCSIPVAFVDPGIAPYVWIALFVVSPLLVRTISRRVEADG